MAPGLWWQYCLTLAILRSLNVDMEWLYGASETSNMEVDIGYVPQVNTQVPLPRYVQLQGLALSPISPLLQSRPSPKVSQGPSLRHPSPLTSGPDGAGGCGPLSALRGLG